MFLKTAEERELSQAQSQAVAQLVLEELARRRLSRKRLAADARISLSTLEKALNGNRSFTLATLIRLEQALAVSLRPARSGRVPDSNVLAPAELGAYSRAAVHALEGRYLTLRPSFEVAGAIYAYRTDIAWDGGKLVFSEVERLDMDNAQKGVLSVPIPSGHIYLLTNEEGQMRMAVLGRQLRTGAMYGLLTTLLAGSGPQLQPVATPLALLPMADGMAFGRILPGEACYESYHRHLARVVEGGFARFPQL